MRRPVSPITRRRAFLVLWLAATVFLVAQLLQGRHEFGAAALPAVAIMLACSAALIWWLPGPRPQARPAEAPTRRIRFLLLCAVLIVGLMLLRDVLGPPLLFCLPLLALGALAALRPPVLRRDLLYFAFLALVAAGAALPMTTAKFPALVWAALQMALVIPCLLAGFALLQRHGLLQQGIGRSLFLTGGWRVALLGAVTGVAIGVPWALFNLVMGGSNNDATITRWWQPLLALQPGIGEEAWGRVFMVPALFAIMRSQARTPAALNGAVIVAGYWFAYLHTPGGFTLSSLFSTALIGTIYAVPLTYIWLRRGLETAIGFHFWQDFVRWAFALLLNLGLV
jgi:hypothetical protein